MSYVSLYRKFRPASFDKVVGQNHIIRILSNQLKSGNLSHAYLFTGSRGTGKTSIAKIFARAINCTNPLADGSPCGKCSVCDELSKGNNIDVLEIDAASNNGVDEIRDLRDNVKYLPSVSKYKVYIIDEVHMLSNSAFNALLKTLEEPPEHVIFILATTEVQKIPHTVMSRCMRLDFRLLTVNELISLLTGVMNAMNITFEQEALAAIAEAGQGSARDTLSLADMCVSYCGNNLTYPDVIEALGVCSPDIIIKLCSYILKGDTDNALREVNDVYSKGKSINTLAKDVATMLSNISYAYN
ncbi:MAG: DNA polymerase III subunit gamma/tau, partial [Clostridia bacterium]|nr:DNA polymerase III subunit gamma/tau [Clostridia bacterium]